MKQTPKLWEKSKINSLLNIDIPLIQAPMAGGITTPDLVSAVSNNGALGSLGAGYMPAKDIRMSINKIRKKTQNPFSVNLFIPESHSASEKQIRKMIEQINTSCPDFDIHNTNIKPPYAPSFDEQIEIVISEKIPVFSFTFGLLDSHWIQKLKQNKTTIMGTATSLSEAKALENIGVDIIIANSFEAGGHRGTFQGQAEDSLIGSFSLIPQLADNLNIPVIAAGGIMDARGITSAFILGAEGVQMGTAFLPSDESGANLTYKAALLNTDQDKTTLTKAFSGKMARGIKNKFINSLASSNDILDYPIQNSLTKGMRQEAAKQNNPDYMSLYAGQSAYLCQELSVKNLIDQLKKDMA